MTAKSKIPDPDQRKSDILAAMLPHVPFDGWSAIALTRAAEDLGIDSALVQLAFPGGPVEAIGYFAAQADEEMRRAIEAKAAENLKLRERITLAVRKRIGAVAPHRQAERRAVTLLALPIYAPDGFAILCRTVDSIWRAVGDRSTDFNYYTKRLTLAGVYSATLLYWLGDESEGYEATWDFLDRRINDVMMVEACKAEMGKPLAALPDIWGFLGKLRYPGSGGS